MGNGRGGRHTARLTAPRLAHRVVTVVLAAAITVALTAMVGWRFALIPLWVFGWITALLAVIDARERLLPNRVLYPALAVAAILLTVAAVFENSSLTNAALQLLDCGLGWLVGWGLMHLAWLFTRKGIGYGDVRLAGYIGLHLGYFQPSLVLTGLVFGLAGAALAGATIAIVRRDLRIKFALGPYLTAGAIAVILFNNELATLSLGGWHLG